MLVCICVGQCICGLQTVVKKVIGTVKAYASKKSR
jgi:hypothetical protein